MKNIYFKFLCLFTFLISNSNFLWAQVFAVTESGDHVILNSNGTWKQIDTSEITIHSLPFSSKYNSIIPQNESIFSKSSNATHLIKSKKIPVGFYLNNKYWGLEEEKKTNQVSTIFSIK